jgi:hypothetical protein
LGRRATAFHALATRRAGRIALTKSIQTAARRVSEMIPADAMSASADTASGRSAARRRATTPPSE